MICLRCGNEIKDNEQICGKCGYNKNNIINKDNAYATINRGVYNQNAIDKNEANKIQEEQKQFDELLQIYIGKMYYNFKKGSFSFCAFFLGHIYFLYRKLYSVGIIIWIINITLSIVFKGSPLIGAIVGLIFNIFLGLTFKKFYFKECIEKVAKIRHDNPNMGFNQLCEYVRTKGGVNKTIALIFGIIMSIPIVITIISLIITIFLLFKAI